MEIINTELISSSTDIPTYSCTYTALYHKTLSLEYVVFKVEAFPQRGQGRF